MRNLKNNLSRFVRRVEAGERVVVTDRGRVVAELVPPGGLSVPDEVGANELRVGRLTEMSS